MTPSDPASPPLPPVLAEAPVLAHVTRGGVVESAHRASLVALDADGARLLAHGGVDDPFFPRSSNKPLQALAMVRAGLDLPPEQLALACSSHSGEGVHRDGVAAVLAGAGLTLEDLRNTPDLPLDEAAARAWLADGRGPERVTQNCSGKHAAMLATCVARGWPLEGYLEPDHPLQRAVAETVAELAGEPVAASATDGCGAPVVAISLAGLARAFGLLASAPAGTAEARVADAMRAAPHLVGGTGRDVTALMEGTPGAVAKDGAEGVYAVGLPDGRAVALKVADGSGRARPVVLAAALRRLGVDSAAYDRLEHAPVLGHGEPVGAVVAVGV